MASLAMGALLLALNTTAQAQQAPAPNPATPASSAAASDSTANANNETIVLSPFEVSSGKDEGYAATSSLAGSRLNTNLKDIASAISVVTPQFLQDTGARSVQDLLIYTTNTQVVGPRGNIFLASAGDFNGQNQILYRPQTQTRVRGLNSADLTRDFWVTDVPLDAYNISGIEIQRGPNSILYGLGSPAGIINYTVKTPIMTKDAYTVEARVDKNGGIRTSADLNKVIIPDTLALRVEGLDDRQKFDQSGTFDNVKRITVSPRWTPKIADSVYTEFTLNYESGQDRANRPILTPPVDDLATWYLPAVSKYIRPTSFSPNPVAGSAQASVIPYLGNYNGASNQWYDQIAVLFSNPNSSVTGGAGLPDALRQRGSGDNGATRPISDWEYITNVYDTWNPANPLNQKATFAKNAKVTSIINDYETKSGRTFGGFQGWQAAQVLDPTVFDYWHESLTGDNNQQWSNFHTLDLSARQTYFNGRAGVEFVYDKQNYKDGYENRINDGYTLQFDINELQPNGQPNPNVGRPEIISNTNAYWSDDKAENSRVTAFYKLRIQDILKRETFLDKIIGEQTFTGVLTSQRNTHDDYSYLLNDWGEQSGDFGYQPMIAVHYLNTAVVPSSLNSEAGLGVKGVNAIQIPGTNLQVETHNNTVGGTNQNVLQIPDYSTTTSNTFNSDTDLSHLITGANGSQQQVNSKAFIWQSRFFDDTLIGLLGVREDNFTKETKDNPPQLPQDNRQLKTYNPFDPTWTYDPKNNLYADATTHSYGIVFHTPKFINSHLPWGTNLTFAYNYATNFQPNNVGTDFYRQQLASPSGLSKDYSVLLSTLDDRLTLRATWYKTTQYNTTPQGTFNWSSIADRVQRTLQGLANDTWGDGRTSTTPESIINKWFFGTNYDATIANTPLNVNWATADAATKAALLAEPLRVRSAAVPGSSNYTPEGSTDSAGNLLPQPPETPNEVAYRTAWFQAKTDAQWFGPLPTDLTSALGLSRTGANNTQWQYTNNSTYKNTADIVSKGVELELTANITPNWRIAVNGSRSTAVQTNVLNAAVDKAVSELENVALDGYNPSDLTATEYQVDYWHRTGFAQIDEWGNGNTQMLGNKFVANDGGNSVLVNYLSMKASDGKSIAELPKYSFNVITSYDFKRGKLKGFGIGGAIRYTGKFALGYYPIYNQTANVFVSDLDSPIFAPAETSYDMWFSYKHKITSKINGSIQLNLRDLFAGHRLIPISSNPDGTYGQYRLGATTSWELTTRLEF